MIRHGTYRLLDDIRAQQKFVEKTVPVYARLLDAIGPLLSGPAGDRVRDAWGGREFRAAYERPLLLLAALRHDALSEGTTHPLHAAVATEPPDLAAVTPERVDAALAADRTRVFDSLAHRAVQTNETSRAITWLWPAALVARSGRTDSIALVDLGASAGLNLIADRLPMIWTTPDGSSVPSSPIPAFGARIGLDRSPLDVRHTDTAMWLRACVWPGQSARQQRLDLAIACYIAASQHADGPRLEACELVEAPARLRTLSAHGRVLALQTLVRDYLTDDERRRYETEMRQWLVECGHGAALWCTLELAGGEAAPDVSAAITVHCLDRAGVLRAFELARCHPHPRVIVASDDAVRSFAAAHDPPKR